MPLIDDRTYTFDKQVALKTMMEDLREETLSWMNWILLLVGVITAISAANWQSSLIAILLSTWIYGLSGLVFYLRREHSKAAAWVLVVGVILILFLLIRWGGMEQLIIFMVIPPGLAVILINFPAGFATAAAASLLLGLPGNSMTAGEQFLPVSLILLWAILGLVWLAVHPLETSLELAYTSYKEGRSQLEQSRDTQLVLNQTLDDLKDANTQLTRLNKLVQNLYHAADESRRVKEQFVANVSHELRTPLNMIIGFSEMILKSPDAYGRKMPPALLADLSVIVRNSQHLSELIDDVLDLSQIEAGQMAITREHVPLEDLVDSAVVAVRPLFEGKHLTLASFVPPGVTLFCDRTRIREVLINLLSNAGRFTNQGGVEVRAIESDQRVTISVKDTGPGLSAEDQKQLFQPFHQVDTSIRRRHSGTGLGLSISKSLVELHHGKMWVESEQGLGSTFSFSLPVELPQKMESQVGRWVNPYFQIEPRTRSSLAPVPVVPPHYIVVDEGSTLQRLLSRYIDQVKIDVARTLAEVGPLLENSTAQAVIINSSASREILTGQNTKFLPATEVPVLLCSIIELAEYTSSLGVSGYLVKPITRDTLIAKLDSLDSQVKTILIADDEPDAIQIFRRMLVSTERGYRILTAVDGAQALTLMRNEKPDLVLLDLSMSVVDGFDVLQTRQENEELREIPVVIISARDPLDQPLSSSFLAVARGDGLKAVEILKSMQSLIQILNP